MDAAAVLTVFGTVIIAALCGWATYLVAIREAKREIDEAFAAHIQALHQDHLRFLDRNDPATPPGGEREG